MIYLGTIGLIMNFAGTVMIALSFGSNPSGGYQADTAGRRMYLASFLRPKLFWFGLAVIALGCSCANSFQKRRAIFKIGRGNAERLSRLVPIEL